MNQQTATWLLNRVSDGEVAAAADLLPLVYDELRALAETYFRQERDSHTLQPTALVHEAYARLVDQTAIEFKSRNQFFVIAARAMRNILIDYARGKGRIKRGRDWREQTIAAVEQDLGADNSSGGIDLERIHQALQRLAQFDERKAMLVELRFFAGVTEQQAAEILGMARSSASEEWRMARAWLHRELRGAENNGE